MVRVYDIRVNHLVSPLGMGDASPRFGWKMESDVRNVFQTAYRVTVCSGERCVFDTGEVCSDETQNIPYEGEPLESRERLRIRVCVKTTAGEASAESFFEMGLLLREDWKGRFIEPENEDADILNPCPVPYLRRSFTVGEGLVAARIYHTAHGHYRFFINGKKGSAAVFAPGDTNYTVRLQYQTDDITRLLSPGENVWAVKLGDGWYRGGYGAGGTRCAYGRRVHYLGQIELVYSDGSREIIPTDESFLTAFGGLREADPKIGTVFDAAMEPEGWMETGFDDSGWTPVHTAPENDRYFGTLTAQESAPVLEQEELAGRPFKDGNNDLVIDFGQNIAGYVRMKLRGLKAGEKVTLEHCEMLHDGCFDDSNVFIKETSIYDRFQSVIYTAKGDASGTEEFCPEFSVFGFRYARVRGYEGEIQPGDFTAVAVYSGLKTTFRFDSSDTLLNRLYQNSLWSQKGNFLDVPTDCPTRERAAWCGDAQVYAKTAAGMMDVYSFFEKWMKDVESEQGKDGAVPSIAPSAGFHDDACREAFAEAVSADPDKKGKVFLIHKPDEDEEDRDTPDGSVGWGDAAVIIPYRMYMAYGDRKILENQYGSAKRWVDNMFRRAKKKNPLYLEEPWNSASTEGWGPDSDFIWDAGFHWGEWSEPGFVLRYFPPGFIESIAKKGQPAVATAYLSYSAGLLSKIAGILGKKDDEAHYCSASEHVASLYEKYLVEEDGTVRFSDEGRQAPYVRALQFGLVTGVKKEKVKEKLLSLVVKARYHLNTGFLSTPFLLNVLTDCGYTDAAYKVLQQTGNPSWLYPITKGATTIFESWDGANLFFGSFNHYSYGAVCDYLLSYVSGVRIDESAPGYRHFFIKPVPGGTLKAASAEFDSVHGLIRSSWQIDGDQTKFSLEIPANTTADIELPDGSRFHVGSGKYNYCI